MQVYPDSPIMFPLDPILRGKRQDPEGRDTSEDRLHLEDGEADTDEPDETFLTPLPAAGEAMSAAEECC